MHPKSIEYDKRQIYIIKKTIIASDVATELIANRTLRLSVVKQGQK